MNSCEHDQVRRQSSGRWSCECGRIFFPSGDTGAEQEAVRLRAELETEKRGVRKLQSQLAEAGNRIRELSAERSPMIWSGDISK